MVKKWRIRTGDYAAVEPAQLLRSAWFERVPVRRASCTARIDRGLFTGIIGVKKMASGRKGKVQGVDVFHDSIHRARHNCQR